MRTAVLLLVVAACQSAAAVEQQAAPDAAAPDSAVPARLVKSQVYGPLSVQDSVILPFAAVNAADILVMTLTLDNEASHAGVIQTDTQDSFYQWGVSNGTRCGRMSETFSLSPRSDVPGATT